MTMNNDIQFSFELPSYDTMEMICYNYHLDGVEVFELLTDIEKQREWNGFGPNRFPRWLRNILSFCEMEILPACYIHDLDYAIGGKKKYFYASNKRFRKNALKCIERSKERIGFIKQQYLKFQIYIIEIICNLFGYKGWKKNKI